MKTTIKLLEEKLKSLDWDFNYHAKKLADVQVERENLTLELTELKTKYPMEESEVQP